MITEFPVVRPYEVEDLYAAIQDGTNMSVQVITDPNGHVPRLTLNGDHVEDILRDLQRAFEHPMDLDRISLDELWQKVIRLDQSMTLLRVHQGGVLKFILLKLRNNRVLFYEQAWQHLHIRSSSVDDRIRVFQKIWVPARSNPEAVRYITESRYTPLREVCRDKYDNKWEWLNDKIVLRNCVGAGRELSEFAGQPGDKSENLLKRALVDAREPVAPSVDEETADDVPEGPEPSETCTGVSCKWQWRSDDGAEVRIVEGVNVIPCHDAADTEFEPIAGAFLACWTEHLFHIATRERTNRKAYVFDFYADCWRDLSLPDIAND